MPRDMTATGRYPPQPKYPPFAFYSCVRLGDPDQLKLIMETDPYFITQNNGAGAPVHFATTYKQLDMLHWLLQNGAEVNQRDERGFTPLHRAAYLFQHEGYPQLYEYLLSVGADPSIRTENYDEYLDPGCKLPVEVAVENDEIRASILKLEEKYKETPKAREPNPDIGDWWALYDYGLEAVKKWDKDYKHPYPEVIKREKDAADTLKRKAERRARREAAARGEGRPSATLTEVPDTNVAFLFPGQGSQAVGMLSKVKDLPAVKSMLATAKTVLGYDLLQVCESGPKEKLDDTVCAQPALFVAGLAAVEALRAENPGVVADASAAAGLSLGEYTALVFAGAMSFEDGLKVVKARAESMSAAGKAGKPHAMLSVVGLSDADLEACCAAAREKIGAGTVCIIANYLFPQGRVVSGHKDALEVVITLANAKGALKAVHVAVSGAFHTPLMAPASEALAKALAGVSIKAPRIPVYSNVTGKPFTGGEEIAAMLCRQLVEPVQWEETMKAMVAAGKSKLYELGPGTQLKAMIKRISPDVWKFFTNVQA